MVKKEERILQDSYSDSIGLKGKGRDSKIPTVIERKGWKGKGREETLRFIQEWNRIEWKMNTKRL